MARHGPYEDPENEEGAFEDHELWEEEMEEEYAG